MIIAVEGPDRFGKTLLAHKLAERLGYTYIKFPNEELDSGRDLRRIINGGLLFDLMAYQKLQNENKLETLESLPEKNYIFDRYKLSEVVHGKANGLSNEVVEGFADLLPDPDITVLVVGRPYGKDNDIFSSTEYQKKVKELYNEAGKDADGRTIRVCNYETPDEMLDKVMRELMGVL